VIEAWTEPRFRLPIYNGTAGASLCRRRSWLITFAAVVLLALSNGACSYKLDSMFSRDSEKSEAVPWENPGTGARGTVTPLASAYTQDGFTCRDFLASYVRKDSESWLQGEGCRIHQGRWEVRHMKPLQRP